MKRTILIITLLAVSVLSFAQSSIDKYKIRSRYETRIDTVMYLNEIPFKLDTVALDSGQFIQYDGQRFTNKTIPLGLDSITNTGDGWLRFYFGGELIDSVYLTQNPVFHDNTLTGLGTSDSVLKVNPNEVMMRDSMINYVQFSDSITKFVTPTQLQTELATIPTIKTITLPAYTTVAERVLNAVSGVDYPSGWILQEDLSDLDLSITHNMNRRIADIKVFMVDDGEERLLINNLAYSGFVNKSKNRVVIESLSAIGYPLVIHLIFAE